MLRNVLSLVLLIIFLTACGPNASVPGGVAQSQAMLQPVKAVVAQAQPVSAKVVEPLAVQIPQEAAASAVLPTAEFGREVVGAPNAAAAPSGQLAGAVGPDKFPAGVSPLTGLPVKDSANLTLTPALVSVTNFPVTARPQAGLSFSPFVYEMYIGEGMTRFLAVFYGNYPEKGESTGITLDDDRIGPVRSGRLPYESLRSLYNGFLVMASASPNVLTGLSGYNNVFGSDGSDINSAMVSATRLQEIASKNPARLKEDALTGLKFDSTAPASGKPGKMVWIPYNYLNQIIWRYDPASGAYHRFQDNADGQTFKQATDRLNGQPLAYSNVVVLFAQHIARRETLIDINLMYINRMPALIFRDGKMYEAYWTTANTEYEKRTGLVRPIRFVDAQGNPFPLKPGQTWVEMVQNDTPYNETVDSQVYFELKTKTQPGSGNWAIHFYPTVPER